MQSLQYGNMVSFHNHGFGNMVRVAEGGVGGNKLIGAIKHVTLLLFGPFLKITSVYLMLFGIKFIYIYCILLVQPRVDLVS